jgi:hypothetical protein
VIRVESVRVARLDDVLAEFPQAKAPYVNIDTQSYERQVLMGASKCFSSFVGVQMELPIIHLYQETWRLHEAVAYRSERGLRDQ